jgi:hypothetical protein
MFASGSRCAASNGRGTRNGLSTLPTNVGSMQIICSTTPAAGLMRGLVGTEGKGKRKQQVGNEQQATSNTWYRSHIRARKSKWKPKPKPRSKSYSKSIARTHSCRCGCRWLPALLWYLARCLSLNANTKAKAKASPVPSPRSRFGASSRQILVPQFRVGRRVPLRWLPCTGCERNRESNILEWGGAGMGLGGERGLAKSAYSGQGPAKWASCNSAHVRPLSYDRPDDNCKPMPWGRARTRTRARRNKGVRYGRLGLLGGKG